LDDGRRVRLEPHDDTVVLGWTLAETFDVTAERLGQAAASSECKVYVAHHHHVESPKERGRRLSSLLTQLDDVQLIRIEREGDAIVWELDDEAHTSELSVVAPSWARAGHVAEELGESETGESAEALARELL
jgi:hypothetical protein